MAQEAVVQVLKNLQKCEEVGLPSDARFQIDNSNSSHFLNQTVLLQRLREIQETHKENEIIDFFAAYCDLLKEFHQDLDKIEETANEFCVTYINETRNPSMAAFLPSNVHRESPKPEQIEAQQSQEERTDKQSIRTREKVTSKAETKKKKKAKHSDDADIEQDEEIEKIPATDPVTGIIDIKGKSDDDMDSKKRRGNLPKVATTLLKKWLVEHLFHPYPTEEEKLTLQRQTGLTLNQISNWFINARRRILQPMLEDVRRTQQLQQQTTHTSHHKVQTSSSSQRVVSATQQTVSHDTASMYGQSNPSTSGMPFPVNYPPAPVYGNPYMSSQYAYMNGVYNQPYPQESNQQHHQQHQQQHSHHNNFPQNYGYPPNYGNHDHQQ